MEDKIVDKKYYVHKLNGLTGLIRTKIYLISEENSVKQNENVNKKILEISELLEQIEQLTTLFDVSGD